MPFLFVRESLREPEEATENELDANVLFKRRLGDAAHDLLSGISSEEDVSVLLAFEAGFDVGTKYLAQEVL